MSRPTELVRWVDDPAASEALKRALREQGEEGPTSAQRALMFEQLAAQLEHAPSNTPFSRLLVRAGRWSAGLLLLGSATWWVARGPEPERPIATHVAVHADAPDAPAHAEPAAPAVLAHPNPTPPAPVVNAVPPAPRLRARRTAEAVAAPPHADPGLELSLLTRARRALLDQPQRALELTAEHARDHAQGLLAEEREAIAIEALLKLGRRGEAVRRAQRFVERFPGSAQRIRLEQLLRPAAPAAHDSSEVLRSRPH